MNDPETPGVHNRKVRGAVKEHGRQIKHRNRQRCTQKKQGNFAPLWVAQSRAQGPHQQAKPEQQRHGQQHLPAAAQLQILPALMAKPEPQVGPPLRQQLPHARPFPQHAAHHHRDQRAKQHVHTSFLARRVAPAQGGRQKQRARHISRGNPEQGQLQMPGAQQIAGQPQRQVDAVKVARVGPVMRYSAAHEGLSQKKQSHDDKIFQGGPLRWGHAGT